MKPPVVLIHIANNRFSKHWNGISSKEKPLSSLTHRLSTIRYCDQIIVLEKSQLVEQGTHETLLENNGVYTRLWEEGQRK